MKSLKALLLLVAVVCVGLCARAEDVYSGGVLKNILVRPLPPPATNLFFSGVLEDKDGYGGLFTYYPRGNSSTNSTNIFAFININGQLHRAISQQNSSNIVGTTINATTVNATTLTATTFTHQGTNLNTTLTNLQSQISGTSQKPFNSLSYSGATNLTINQLQGDVFYATLTNTTHIAVFSNQNSNWEKIWLYLKQDGTGARVVTFNGGIKWSGATTPTVTTNASRSDLLSFTRDAYTSTNWVGKVEVADYR